jgi:hypothetical protein
VLSKFTFLIGSLAFFLCPPNLTHMHTCLLSSPWAEYGYSIGMKIVYTRTREVSADLPSLQFTIMTLNFF